MSSHFECEVGNIRAGEPCVVAVKGEVDLSSATDLEAGIRQALGGNPASVVLDLAALTFIDSSGLRVLVSVADDARSQGVGFELRNVPSHAQRVLDITGLSGMFDGASDT